MSKRKGLSLEEKRTRMLQIFHESKDFYQLKELEKIAPKEKGIIMQSVKEVVQSLADDGLVDTEKIGTSVYFWSYPSKAINIKKRKLVELNTQIEEATKKLKKINEKISESKLGKEESNHRNLILEEITHLEAKMKDFTKKIELHKESDPEMYEKLKSESKIAIEAANRWTDNIFAIKSWCTKKFPIEESVLNKQFEIPPDLDYIS